MTNPPAHDDPLTPEQERIVRRIRRLSFLSAGIMVLGLAAVFSVIAYRLYTAEPSSAQTPSQKELSLIAAVQLPKGAQPLNASLDGHRLVVTVMLDNALQVIVYDAENGTELNRVRIQSP